MMRLRSKFHGILVLVLTLVSSASLVPVCRAGYDANYRKNCNIFAKYRLRAELNYNKGFTHSHYYCPGGCVDKGCSFAEVNETWYDNQAIPPVVNASIQYRIGSGGYAPITTTLNKYYSAGNAFVAPLFAGGDDSLGVARATLTCDVLLADEPGGTMVTLSNFSGLLLARSASAFGASFRCVAWQSASPVDSEVTKSNLRSDSDVRIENGVLHATGIFSPSDFVTSTVLDSSGYTAFAVGPVNGLSKTIHLAGGQGDNSVSLSVFGDVGYGTYDSESIFRSGGDAFVLPALQPLGAALAALLLIVISARQLLRRAMPGESA